MKQNKGIPIYDRWKSDEKIFEIVGKKDEAEAPAAAVLIVKDGRILCGTRLDNGLKCGPGGHVEEGEDTKTAAIRETLEEFNIIPLNLISLGVVSRSTGLSLPSMVYFTDEYEGTVETDGTEMVAPRWMTLEELSQEKLFEPFEESIKKLTSLLTGDDDPATITAEDGGPGSGFPNHGGRPGKVGGSVNSKNKGKITHFSRRNGSMEITSDMKVKANMGSATIKAGTKVTKIVDFAGPGKKKAVSVEPHLIKQYGGSKGSWKHTRGEAEVVYHGKAAKAEIHWFESRGIGQVNMKVKRFLGEDEHEG